MNSEQDESRKLIDITDCLEAVSVFRGCKNALFVIVIFCLMLLQVSFWLIDIGYIKIDKPCCGKSSTAACCSKQTVEVGAETGAEAKQEIEKAAEEVAALAPAPDKPSETTAELPSEPVKARFVIEFKHLAHVIRFVNFLLIPAAILYCLTLLFALKISLVGRLGGINHISRAFFISLVFVILLLPWQKFFSGIVSGAMYTPWEVAKWYSVETTDNVFGTVFYYLRFVGYWLLVLLLLIFSFARSNRWARTILRRLEVV